MMRQGIVLLLLVICLACTRPGIRHEPASGEQLRSLVIRFQFKDDKGKQQGRMVWRFDAERSKFVFITPLGQTGLELDVAGENAVLVNFTQKKHWRGVFSELLERMWGVAMSFEDLKTLLLTGEIRGKEFDRQGIAVDVELNSGSGTPQAVRLRQGSADLTFRVIRDASRTGRVVPAGYETRYPAADLEEILE